MMTKIIFLLSLLMGMCLTTLPYANAQSDDECVDATTDSGRQARRRRPGLDPVDCKPGQNAAATLREKAVAPRRRSSGMPDPMVRRNPNPVSPVPRPSAKDYVAPEVVNRWKIVDALGYEDNWWNPYNRNTLKADKPIHGDWFFNLGIISDTFYENREVITPVGVNSSNNAGSLDVIGSPDQMFVNQNLSFEFVYYKGDTVFRPPDYEFRFIPVINYNYIDVDEVAFLNADPGVGTNRDDEHVAVQALFADIHIRNVSDRYDFDSIRFGIQPFNSDFRGFLFQDSQLGIRLFGNRDNNIFQYNLSLFQRVEKDTNSGLNDLGEGLRDDYVFAANVYWQDLFVTGFTSQFTVVYNKNEEGDDIFVDNNNFIARPASLGRGMPRDYDVVYLGYSGDGHFGRYNLSTSMYFAFGEVDQGVFVNQPVDIEAAFFAAEFSIDYDWIRPRLSFLYATGDDDPFDDTANGFDAIFENPQFAGNDTSYWIRQAVPLVGGGRVTISGRNGVLNSLRSSKELGQSNFTNPGTILLGAGVDVDLMPEFRVSANVNALYFETTEVLQAARNQGDIDEEIGIDASVSATFRPLMSQNIVLRAAYARLFPGDGYNDLFNDDDADYFMINVLLAY